MHNALSWLVDPADGHHDLPAWEQAQILTERIGVVLDEMIVATQMSSTSPGGQRLCQHLAHTILADRLAADAGDAVEDSGVEAFPEPEPVHFDSSYLTLAGMGALCFGLRDRARDPHALSTFVDAGLDRAAGKGAAHPNLALLRKVRFALTSTADVIYDPELMLAIIESNPLDELTSADLVDKAQRMAAELDLDTPAEPDEASDFVAAWSDAPTEPEETRDPDFILPLGPDDADTDAAAEASPKRRGARR